MSILKSYNLKLGNKCNNNCTFCDELDKKTNINKSFKEIKQEIDNLKRKNYTHLILPCNSDIRKNFFEILKYAKNLGFRITLETNGRMFYYKEFAEEVKDNIDELVIYFFGQDPDVHDENTQVKGSYDQAKKGEINVRKLNIPVNIKKVYWPTTNQKFMFDNPREVVIEVTSKCNFNCKICFNKISFAKEGKESKDMSTDYVKKIIDDIAESSIPIVRFSGGEPLLRKDIFDLMEHAKSKGLRIWLNTNSSLITKEYAFELKKYVENVLVTFNGYDNKSDFEWTNTSNSFKDKIKGVKLLKKNNIPIVRAGTVVTKENIDNLEKIYNVLKINKISRWQVYRPIPLKNEGSQFYIKKLCKKLIKLSLDFGQLIPIANAIPFCCSNPKKMDALCLGACFDDGHSRIIIDPRGFAKPDYFSSINIGDPTRIIDCWNNNLMKQVRELKLVPEQCKKCIYLEKCKGGSIYIAKLYNGYCPALDPLAMPDKYEKELFLGRTFPHEKDPFVSVIVPTYNRKEVLHVVISALLQQNYPKYEIIVVDDGSDDGTNRLIQDMIKKYPIIRYAYQENRGFRVARARNLGGKLAHGEIVLFLDGDIVALPDLIANHVKALKNCDVVLGYTAAYSNREAYNLDEIKNRIVSGASSLCNIRVIKEFRHSLFVDSNKNNSDHNKDIWGFFVANNFSTWKHLFCKEQFNESFVGWGAEDEEYGYRLYTKGNKIKMDINCTGLHMEHPEEKLTGIYTSSKVDALLKNFIRFYEFHPNKVIEEYVKSRYYQLPEKFKSSQKKTYLLEGIDRIKKILKK